jgi:hypothetical protein
MPSTVPASVARGRGDYLKLDVFSWFAAHGCDPVEYPAKAGAYDVTCPWSDQHTDPDSRTAGCTLIWEAHGKCWPNFHCKHAHCSGRAIEDVMQLWQDADIYCRALYRERA